MLIYTQEAIQTCVSANLIRDNSSDRNHSSITTHYSLTSTAIMSLLASKTLCVHRGCFLISDAALEAQQIVPCLANFPTLPHKPLYHLLHLAKQKQLLLAALSQAGLLEDCSCRTKTPQSFSVQIGSSLSGALTVAQRHVEIRSEQQTC